GTGADDFIEGNHGDDSLAGGDGNDTLAGGQGNDVFVITVSAGNDTVTDFDIGDSDGDGASNDRFDVSEITTAEGAPVTANDVSVSDDGYGNAVLTFPLGETVTLQGVSPYEMTPGQLYASGIPCFTSGTMIMTPDGEKLVEQLGVGDLVETVHDGPQPVLWHTTRNLDQDDLLENPDLKPVWLDGDWTGDPRGLLVSAQHGIAVTPKSGGALRLVRASQLAKIAGGKARVARGKSKVKYVHLLFRKHQIVFANGIQAESFYPGAQAISSLGLAERLLFLAKFPQFQASCVSDVYGPPRAPYCKTKDLPERLDGLRPVRAIKRGKVPLQAMLTKETHSLC
uniref:Hint domain-containing protein n=1 Tax=unclassified Mameliella TaxID=2630630 RepID=UPI00273F739A